MRFAPAASSRSAQRSSGAAGVVPGRRWERDTPCGVHLATVRRERARGNLDHQGTHKGTDSFALYSGGHISYSEQNRLAIQKMIYNVY